MMDKEKVIDEENLEEVTGGVSETDLSCDDTGTNKINMKCKFKGKVSVCPYSPSARSYMNCGDCDAEKH